MFRTWFARCNIKVTITTLQDGKNWQRYPFTCLGSCCDSCTTRDTVKKNRAEVNKNENSLYRTHYIFLFQPDNISVYCTSVQIDSPSLFKAVKQINDIFTLLDSLSEIISFNLICKFRAEGKALHFAVKIWRAQSQLRLAAKVGERCHLQTAPTQPRSRTEAVIKLLMQPHHQQS